MGENVDVRKSVGELGTQELTLVVRGTVTPSITSSADIIHVKQANKHNVRISKWRQKSPHCKSVATDFKCLRA